VLCGRADAITAAREERGRLGGRMRQAGVIAAAGVVALESMVERLADDHVRARRLASILAARFPGSVDPAAITTNIVCCPAAALPADLLSGLAHEGVLAGTIDPTTVRFVTHKDIDDADLDRVEKVIGALVD
jgi:threonine aldolase